MKIYEFFFVFFIAWIWCFYKGHPFIGIIAGWIAVTVNVLIRLVVSFSMNFRAQKIR